MVNRCNFSKYHCLLFLLVLAAVVYFYIINLKNMVPRLNPKLRIQTHPTKLFIPFRGQNAVSQNTGRFTAVFSQSNRTTTRQPSTEQTTITSAMTQQGLQTPIARPMPVPYVSPGPYLVEYPYKYSFLINEPKKCQQEKPFVVLMVPVAPHNRQDRDMIRSTWGGERQVLGKEVRLFFLLGSSNVNSEQLREKLLQESKEHKDLIQSNFVDCYKNLTIKTMVMMEWLHSYCSSASYAMKIDSDVFLNVHNLVHMLLKAPRTKYMTGQVVYDSAVLRDHSTKWYLPVDLFPQDYYPPYALGLGYILSLDLPKLFMKASRHVKALYIEDVYLGLCMSYLGIPPTNPPEGNYFNVFPKEYNRCAFSKIVATTLLSNTNCLRFWKDFKRPDPYCTFVPIH
ncbi:beta-1,3-galactosyltransferase 2-like [Melanotaenia boesemani]|uniref:beta-1,3-galactosyltransferase 2-like n=1 Tax=Melanotaenia boesemani TaxID=1250792 RepID=UPI001C05DFE2|nr:beta-1,3-galactosyltransferase 2-like [Melanotaenia boesemani]